MAEDKMDLAGLIATAKQQASRALAVAQEEVGRLEGNLTAAREKLVATVREVAKVLDTQEIAGLIGESHRQVLYWVSHGTAKRTRKKVEVVEQPEVADLSGLNGEAALDEANDPRDDLGMIDTGEDILGAPA